MLDKYLKKIYLDVFINGLNYKELHRIKWKNMRRHS